MMSPWLMLLILVSFLILLFILVPIRYELGFAYHAHLNLYASIRQGVFFRFAMEKMAGKSEFKLHMFNIPLSLSKGSQDNKKSKQKSGSSSPLAVLRNLFRNKTYRPLGKLMIRLFQAIKPKHLQIKGKYGFDEPHYTSWANMLLLFISSDSPNYQIHMEPVWDEEQLDIEGFIKGSITIAGITWHIIRFVLSPSFWRFLIDLSRDKKRKKLKIKPAIIH
ncbi:MAG: hypothetical protein PHX14_12710 [Syntrophomonadaceae bacterium]|nr:hypothetical protein [Syntrophomonadaceae bacterium]